MKNNFLTILFLFFVTYLTYSQTSTNCDLQPSGDSCSTSAPLCSDNNGTLVFRNNSDATSTGAGQIGCLATTPRPSWFYIKVDQTGRLEFEIEQREDCLNGNLTGNTLDVDFVAWGPFRSSDSNCGVISENCFDTNGNIIDCATNIDTSAANNADGLFYINNRDNSNIIDCSYDGAPLETFTIPDAQAGDFYILLVTNFIGGEGFIKLQQTNFGQTGAGVTDCSIIAGDLGADQNICETTPPTPVTLNGEPTNPTTPIASYQWQISTDGGTTFNDITGETNSTLTIDNNVSGSYQVIVTDTGGISDTSDDVIITFLPPPTATAPADIDFCDTDGAGHTFDLTTNDTTIIGSQTDVEVRYYNTQADANANTNAITSFSPTTNVTQEIWARVFNTDLETDLDCDTTTSFEINYSVEPTPATATNITICDDATSGSATDGIFTFPAFINKDIEILGSLSATDYSVSYHTTSSGASTNATTDVIDKNVTYTNTTSPYTQTIHVRVESNINSSICAVTQNFTINVLDLPVANTVTTIEKCDDTGGTTQTFNFDTEATPSVLLTQSNTDFEVLYFETPQAAIDNVAGTNITGTFTNTSATQTIYVRIHNTSNPDLCPQFTDFDVIVHSTPILNNPFVDQTQCVADDFSITIDSTADTFVWEVSEDNGATWNTVVADANYSNETTTSLMISDVPEPFNGFQYRVILGRIGNSCSFTSNSMTLTVNPLPTPVDVTLLQCDNDADLISNVNLTLEQPNISTNHATETFEYYTNVAHANAGSGASLIPDPTAHNATNGDIVYVRTISAENCAEVSQITIVVSFAADVPYNRTFIQCDDFLDFDGNDTPRSNDDTDGLATFDFSDARTEILAFFPLPVRNDLDVKFFETIADRASEVNEIPDISNHRNNNDPAYANQQTIYAKIVNTVNNDCTGLAELILDVTPVPTANPINATNQFEACDDFMDGDGANGIIQSWNLESLTPTILGTQNPANYTVTYHATQSDADSGTNLLTSPHTNTITPTANRQTIYVRVAGNGCDYSRYSFDLVVNSLPIANPLNMTNTHEVCDNDSDGSATNGFVQNIDLQALTPTILGTQSPANFTVTYHTGPSRENANLITGLYTNTTAGGNVVYVRIEENTGCINDRHEIIIQVNPEPLGNPGNTLSNLSLCDNDGDGDDTNGFVQTFDLESQIPNILGDPAVQDEDDFNVTFHLSQADATSGTNPQSSPFTNTIINQQTIYVRIENKATSCVNDDINFEVIVNPLPDFVVTTPQPICLNNPPLTLVAENPNDVYTYQWFDASGSNIGNDISLDVTVGGKYTVTATTTNGTGCPRSRTITVTESNIAVNFDIGDVTIDDDIYVDGSNTNSITINNSNLGQGDYEFALLNQNGITIRSYQDEPIFDDLEGGIYTINVRDKNGCGVVSLTVAVIEFPKFFTPNGDGFNDTWAIKGGSTSFFPTNLVQIFNRQGKVITQFNFNTPGWNGLYKENQMPSDDYWFKIMLTDTNGNTFTKRGHFSLLRK